MFGVLYGGCLHRPLGIGPNKLGTGYLQVDPPCREVCLINPGIPQTIDRMCNWSVCLLVDGSNAPVLYYET